LNVIYDALIFLRRIVWTVTENRSNYITV